MSATEDKDKMDGEKTVDEDKDAKKSKKDQKKNKKDKKPDPERFKGAGVNFRAKLIGIEPVPEARGDKMCQEAMTKVKASVKAAGEHKQKILVNVSVEGLKIMEEKSTVVLHHHAVHKISFISRDVNDARAFGYVYGPGEGKHEFYGIKTDKPAEGLVLSLRDLFQVVFEMKKKEVELQKQKRESIGEETPSTSSAPSDLTEPKVTPPQEGVYDAKSTPTAENTSPAPAEEKPAAEPAVGDLLDLNTELSFLQQGIAQMNSVVDETPAPADQASAWATPWATPPAGAPAGSIQFPVTFNSPGSPQPVAPFPGDPFVPATMAPGMPPQMYMVPPQQAAMMYGHPGMYAAYGQPPMYAAFPGHIVAPGVAPAAPVIADPFQSDPFFSKPLQPESVSSSGFESSPALPVKNGHHLATADPFSSLDAVGGAKPYVPKEEFFRSESPTLNQLTASRENLTVTSQSKPAANDPFAAFPTSSTSPATSSQSPTPGNPFA